MTANGNDKVMGGKFEVSHHSFIGQSRIESFAHHFALKKQMHLEILDQGRTRHGFSLKLEGLKLNKKKSDKFSFFGIAVPLNSATLWKEVRHSAEGTVDGELGVIKIALRPFKRDLFKARRAAQQQPA